MSSLFAYSLTGVVGGRPPCRGCGIRRSMMCYTTLASLLAKTCASCTAEIEDRAMTQILKATGKSAPWSRLDTHLSGDETSSWLRPWLRYDWRKECRREFLRHILSYYHYTDGMPSVSFFKQYLHGASYTPRCQDVMDLVLDFVV